jgi:uncharacterized membrane protein
MTGMESPQRPRIVSWWDLAALAGFLGLAGFYARILPSLPDPVPTHFNALGQANGWTPKAGLALVVFLPPAILWGILFLIGLVAAMLPPGPRSLGAAPVLPLRGLLGLGMCLLMGGCLLVPLQGMTALFSGLLAFFVCMALGIVFLVREVWNAARRVPGGQHIKAGLFYVNPQDPRLWVEKPVGYGWTLNFARPAATVVMLLIMAAAVGLVLGVKAALGR